MNAARLIACWSTLALCAWANAQVRDLSIDPLTSTEHWQVGGRRINYTLGDSSLTASPEQVREGVEASLRLQYDFEEPRRDYVSAYHTGDAIPGVCHGLLFWLYGNASGCKIRLSLEDARGRWYERDVGAIDWEGWERVPVIVGESGGWRPLLRIGEEREPILHPVNLRQIAVLRPAEGALVDAIYLSDLRAAAEVVPADFVSAELLTGRPANLFEVGETPTVAVTLANRGEQEVSGQLVAAVTDFSGNQRDVDLGPVAVEPGQTLRKELRYETDRIGAHDVEARLETPDRERLWFTRFAVTRAAEPPPADPDALFGCMFNLSGFAEQDMETVFRLNRDAGIRWARIGFNWGEINPAPGVWAWDGPKRIDGPVGKAIELDGQPFRLPHSPLLDCPDAVTIALWARGTGPNGSWQTPIQKWGSGDRRNYGVYFHLNTGEFCFSGSYEKLPDVGWRDFNSSFAAWDGQWHHYAATYSAQARKVMLYVDGELKTAADHDGGRLRTNAADLVIGSGFPGAVDEMVLYGRALSPAEVIQLARKEAPPADGLIAWWPFDGTGPALADRSPNRLNIAAAEPSPERWAKLALEHGIKTLGLLGFPPRWASTAPEDADRVHTYKPDLDAWAAFVENVARHYKDLVQHWEIWNEPNITVFWSPEPDAEEFIDVVKVGYEAAKRGNPDCTVIMPGLAGPGQNRWGMEFLDELLELGAARYCDAISIHPYRQTTPEGSDLVGDLQHIADMAEEHGGRRPIWFTENCWTTHIPGGSTEQRQAVMLPRCYVLSLATGLMERFIWFRLHDPGLDRFYTEHNYGMCYNDLTPKPAYFAHRTVATLLEGAQPDGEWDVGPNAMARCFRTPDERIAAVWCPDGTTPVSIYTGQPETTVVDTMGNEQRTLTDRGVLVLEATEAVTFLRDLPANAEGRGTMLTASEPVLVRGERGDLTVRVRNPFGSPRAARISLTAEAPVSLESSDAELEVAANGTEEVSFGVSTAPDARPGAHTVIASLVFSGRTYTQELPVSVRSAPRDAGPVGYWKLDEDQGTVIKDSSPSGNDGTVEQPKWVEGKHGGALEFDGTHIAVVPDAPSLYLPDEVTLAFWLRLLGETGTWQFPVTKYLNENVRRNYGIYLHREELSPCFSASFERGTYLHNDVGSGVPVNDGQWHHIAATYSMFEGRVRIYVDGDLATDQATDMGAMLPADTPLRIGTATIGAIDEVIVYPRVLSAEEIAELAK